MATVARLTVRPQLAHLPLSGGSLAYLRAVVHAAGLVGGSGAPAAAEPIPGLDPRFGEIVTARGIGEGRARDTVSGRDVLLFLHGGGYVTSSARAYRPVTSELSARTGLAVVAVDYARAPEHRFPAALDDVVHVWEHLVASGVRPERIVVMGDSAGAHLAIGLLVTLAGRGAALPAGVVLTSPLFDASMDEAVDVDRRTPDPVISPAFARRCLDAYVGSHPLTDPRISPLSIPEEIVARFPPMLTVVGDTECFRGDAVRWDALLRRCGVPSYVSQAPGQIHSHIALTRLVPEARTTLARTAGFVAACLHADRDRAVAAFTVDAVEADPRGRYALASTDDAFFETAPVRAVRVLDVPVSPERLWAELAADDAVVAWSPAVTRSRWLTPRPFGVGTVREVTLGGLLTVREDFYRWDENARMTFSASAVSLPGIRGFAEDYRIEATATGSRLTWVVAMEPAARLGPGEAALSAALRAAVGDLTNGLRRRLLGDGRR